jgi:type II secretory pathway component GspD/PulD (secretin)
MKSKTLIIALLAGLVWQQEAYAQTNINAPDQSAANETAIYSKTGLFVVKIIVAGQQPAANEVASPGTTPAAAETNPPPAAPVAAAGVAPPEVAPAAAAAAETNPPAAPTATAEVAPATPAAAAPETAPAAPATAETAPVATAGAATNPPAAPAATAEAAPAAPAAAETAPVAAAGAETNPPAAPAATAEAAPAAPAAAAETNQVAAVAETNPPVVTAPVATETNQVAAVAETNPPVVTAPVAAETNQVAAGAATNPPAPKLVSIPVIQFQDVPITTAIENLARQAGINFLLDPKIGYGQPDQSGQIKPEPTLSVRWEDVTAEQALLALLDNYGLQLVEDPRTQIARITTRDPTAPPPLLTRVLQLKYSSVSNMVDAVQAALTDKRSKVLPDMRTSQLIVVATEKEQTAVSTLVEKLDKPTRQVLIETRLIEVSSNPSTVKGIDWSGTLAAQNIYYGNGILKNSSLSTTLIPGTPVTTTIGGRTITTTPASSESTEIDATPGNGGVTWNTASGFSPNIGFLNADGVHAVLSFLNQTFETQVISTPRIVTLDNEPATIAVTRAYPVFNTTAGTQGSPGGSQIQYTNLGTILIVTPRISANDYIWLKVAPQVSSLFGVATKTVASETYQADIFDFRQIDTQVLIPNGNTLVMGGLVKDSPNATYTKVPVLGDIPILGLAFRSENKSLDKDNLLIFITPTIVVESDFQPTKTDFLKSKPEPMAPPLNPDTAWESAKPSKLDWSNPWGNPESFFNSPEPAGTK